MEGRELGPDNNDAPVSVIKSATDLTKNIARASNLTKTPRKLLASKYNNDSIKRGKEESAIVDELTQRYIESGAFFTMRSIIDCIRELHFSLDEDWDEKGDIFATETSFGRFESSPELENIFGTIEYVLKGGGRDE